jgi:hypothetical protein
MKILISILVLCISYNSTFAHSCRSFKNLSDAEYYKQLEKLKFIFYGEVISTINNDTRTEFIEFKVLRAWKGIKTNKVTIKLFNPCGIKLTMAGGKMMVYGYALTDENLIEVDCCSFESYDDERTKRKYGEGKVFEEAASQITSEQNQSTESFWSSLWQKIVSFFS